MSLIREAPERRVRMANLATVGSFAVNGVAELQSRLLAQTTLRDFAELWPEKFLNKPTASARAASSGWPTRACPA
jgi:Glucan phosphorylase